MRFRLHTLLILLAILPPLLWIGWGKYAAWKAERDRLRAIEVLQARQLQVVVVIAKGDIPLPPLPVTVPGAR